MENFWAYCLLKFEQELSAQQYNTWIKPLKARINGESVQIVAPNKFVMQWVKSKFYSRIETIATELSPTARLEL
ncbi:MAG TPA: DnaA N-terminal domain-containing protein, partial [Cellvibrio sp.]